MEIWWFGEKMLTCAPNHKIGSPMKKSVLSRSFLIALSSFFTMNAVSSTYDMPHMPRDGEQLHPNIAVRAGAISKVDESSRTVSFNPDLFSPLDEADARIYINEDTLGYVQFATKQKFTLRGDTLSYLGYENRASEFNFAGDVLLGTLSPLQSSAGSSSGWTGRITLHGSDLLKQAIGRSRTEVQGGWTLTSDTDTVRNATYMLWDMDMAYFDTASVTDAEADTIRWDEVSDLILPVDEMATQRLLTRRELWFSDQARYPVLLRSSVFQLRQGDSASCDTIPVSVFASWYPAAFQYADTGELPSDYAPRKIGNSPYADGKGPGSTPGNSDNTGVLISEATAGGDTVTVTVSSGSGSGPVTLTLFTDSGIRLSEPLTVTVTTVPRAVTLPIPPDASGVLILHIDSDTGSTSRKIIR